MANNVLIGVDIGTTGCRAEAYDESGRLVAEASLDYSLHTPRPGWVEQDPAETTRCVYFVLRSVSEQCSQANIKPAGICFSSVFHSLLPVSSQGLPLHPVLVWADQRSHHQAQQLKTDLNAHAVYQRTGCPIHPMYPLAKILWLREEMPSVFDQTRYFVSIKEFILQQLTGHYFVDHSIASGTGLYNFHTRTWDPELLSYLKIDAQQLSILVPTTHISEGLLPERADSLGLPRNIPVIWGAGDGVMSNIGSGAVKPDQVTAMIGTSGAVRLFSDQPKTDAQGSTWCYNVNPSIWMIGGAINSGGLSLRWVRDALADSEQIIAKKLGMDVYDLLSRYAQQIPPGSAGLLSLPFFSGERSPDWNSDARGIIFGLNMTHEKRHIVRATMEGIVFRLFSVYQTIEKLSDPICEIRASGSFIRSRLWVQIMADIWGQTVSVPAEPQGAAYGSTLFARVALGQIQNLQEAGKQIKIIDQYRPDMDNHQLYQELYEIYKRVYHNLQAELSEIAQIQHRFAGR